MRISSAFPSEYLKAADLQGRTVTVTMERVEMQEISGDHKPVLLFRGKDKGMILNKTNSNNISLAYGDETDEWSGQQIQLYEAMVDFQGKTVPAIRIRIAPRKAMPRPDNAARVQSDPAMNDEIPF